jgi:hypothetical protein
MKSLQALARKLGKPKPADIDQLYGLEPVYEPGDDPRLVPLETDTQIQCPWCGEQYGSAVDVSAGDQQLTEDCQVCCRPIELEIRIDRRSGAVRVQARRADG